MTLPLDLAAPVALDQPDAASQTTALEVTGEGTDSAAEMTEGASLTGAPSRPPWIVGLDLSLSAAGIAVGNGVFALDTPLKETATLDERVQRMRNVAAQVGTYCAGADLVALEGPSFNSRYAGFHESAGLWWRVYNHLRVAGLTVVVVPPANVKKFATGNGNAGKPAMVAAAIRRLGYERHDDNEADALWLRAAALDHYGFPLCPMPAVNRAALTKVAWPELGTVGT